MLSKHNDKIKHVLLNNVYNASSDLEEYNKCLMWANTVLSLPTEVKGPKNDISNSINRLYEILTANMSGMSNVIAQILQAVCAIITDPENRGYVLALVGPPGVGKTTISTLIAQAIGMGFGQISCGSICDQATIVGHSSTYIGAKTGIFTQIQIASGQIDNVVLLDEMDKLPDKKMLPVLLHILDKTQNAHFKDAYCPEIDIDLSKNLYVSAVNSVDTFDDALKDRLKIVTIDGYDVEQKCEICLKHVIPKIVQRTCINKKISYDVIKKCIMQISPNISGMRDMERFIGDIYEKLSLMRYMKPLLFKLPAKFDINKHDFIDKKLIENMMNISLE
jgi:ATP-dependent Lon protease